MKTIEKEAKTVEEAIEDGLQELGVAIGDVDVETLDEGSKGLFGLFGSKMAKVRLTVKETDEDPLKDLLEDDKKTSGSVKGKKPALRKQAYSESAVQQKPEESKSEKSADKPERSSAMPEPVRRTKKAVHEKPAGEILEDGQGQTDGSGEDMYRLDNKPEVTMIAADGLDAESLPGIAAAFLKDITRLMGVETEISMGTDAEGNIYGYITGETMGMLIGRRGETLDAIQYLTSLKINHGRDTYTRIILDTENYRAKREDSLIRLANRMANRATRTGRRVSFEPMNPYERRIIHFALQKNDLVETHSEGEEPNRHVVITLKK